MNRDFILYFSCFSAAAGIAFPAWAESNAGHALAQKFAVEDKSAPQPAKPQPKRVAQTKPAATRALAPGQDYEREMLEAAKAEAAQRQTSEQDKSKATGATAPVAAPVAAAQKAADVPSSNSAPVATPAAGAEPPAKKDTPPGEIKVQANVPAASPTAGPKGTITTNRATILVVLNQTGSGEIPKTFDPILCLGEVCYVSTGSETEARRVARKDALSTKSSMATGAGVCAGLPACAFRGIDLPEGTAAQIVDLGLVRPEQREAIKTKIDLTCTVEDDFLACDRPVTAPDYRIWIVPEAVAAKAGGERIEAALDAELPEENVTLETDK